MTFEENAKEDRKKGCFAITSVAFKHDSEEESELEEHHFDTSESLEGSLLDSSDIAQSPLLCLQKKFKKSSKESSHKRVLHESEQQKCHLANDTEKTEEKEDLKKAFERSESTDTLKGDDVLLVEPSHIVIVGQKEVPKEAVNSRFKVYKLKSARGRWKCCDFFDDDQAAITYKADATEEASIKSTSLAMSPLSHISISHVTHNTDEFFFNSLHIHSFQHSPNHSNLNSPTITSCFCHTNLHNICSCFKHHSISPTHLHSPHTTAPSFDLCDTHTEFFPNKCILNHHNNHKHHNNHHQQKLLHHKHSNHHHLHNTNEGFDLTPTSPMQAQDLFFIEEHSNKHTNMQAAEDEELHHSHHNSNNVHSNHQCDKAVNHTDNHNDSLKHTSPLNSYHSTAQDNSKSNA